ncbi:MAG: outer membrane protein assembly factor BamB family protein, partial [Candidatus Hodarchaeales archaeon]
MKKHLLAVGIILLLLSSSFVGVSKPVDIKEESTQNSPPMDSPWPMYGHDARHTFQSQYNSDDNPGIEKWRFGTFEGARSTPVIDNNGNIYFGGHTVYSLSSNGTLNWEKDIWGCVGGTIAIDENDIIYFPTTSSYPSYFYAYDLNGSEIWKYQQEWESRDSSPAISEDGTIYFGDWSGFLYALNPDGTLKWRYKLDDFISSSPAIDKDGNIYCISWEHFDEHLYAFSPDGKRKWKKDDVRQDSDVSIDDNGTIYYVSWTKLYAINADGSLIWSTPAFGG